MTRTLFAGTLLAVTALGLAGCSDEAATHDPPGAGSPADSGANAGVSEPATAETPPAASPTLTVVDELELAKILEAHRGEVVLLDFWATWCLDCVELLPHNVELQRELGDKGLHVILVSLDSPDDRKENAQELLADKGVTFESYISKYGSDPKSAEVFEIEGASIPHIKLYDREGKIRQVFSSGRMPPEPFDANDIEDAVRKLVAEG